MVRCIDGDSVIFDIDCGFDVHLKAQSVRLYGIDTAETRGGTPELKVLGNIAKDYVTQMIPVGSEVLLKTHLDRKGKFGRILAEIYMPETVGVEGYQEKSQIRFFWTSFLQCRITANPKRTSSIST